MLFNSFEYFIFFMAVMLLYFLLKVQHHRIWLLIVASCFFYMYLLPQYILILFAVILIDYFSGIAISKQQSKKRKRLFLLLSIFSNLGILFFFKYFNFFIENIESISGASFYKLNIILPIGLSFHTFQSLSYTIEVYKGNYEAQRRLDVFALYVLYFPQLVAGPIERPQHMIHQLKEFKPFDNDKFISGVKLMSLGLIKKCIIADRLSILVDNVYADVDSASGPCVWMTVIAFSLQIYFDFSGYSDIALGTARCMGVDLMKNFDRPYVSFSIKEFWQRWHISLSTWFRDYVFIPLGGSKGSMLQHFRNIMITFALSGLWHGANWNFVVWGLWHGVLVFISSRLNWGFHKFSPAFKFLDIGLNFLLVALLWVFFRSPDLATVKSITSSLFQFSMNGRSAASYEFGITSLALVFLFTLYVLLLQTYFSWENGKNTMLQTIHLAFIFALIMVYGVFNNLSFIYFQF